jgi:hypothetical protein
MLQQRPYQHIWLTVVPLEPASDPISAKSGVRSGVNARYWKHATDFVE